MLSLNQVSSLINDLTKRNYAGSGSAGELAGCCIVITARLGLRPFDINDRTICDTGVTLK
jgi:hypothetical protein